MFSARAFGTQVRIPRSAISLAREIYGRACYFPDASFVPKKGDAVIDLGANCGVFTALAAKLGARVRAVEAQSGMVRECRETLAANGCTADVICAMVGAGGDLGDRSKLETASHFEGTIPPSLSMEAAMDGFEQVDLLKCDIEGSEYALFLENNRWLDRVRRITMEIHPAHGSPESVAAQLGRRGFRAWTTPAGYLYAIRA
jgi:FkbM family methyltransferase